VSATLRGRINPLITFPEVQAISEEIGIAAKALAASRPPPRAPAPGLLPVRPRPVAAMAEDQSTITFADAYHSAQSGFELAQFQPLPPRWSTTALNREYLVRTRRRSCRPHHHALQGGGFSIGGDRIVEANLVDR
jgi:hypothetical protein